MLAKFFHRAKKIAVTDKDLSPKELKKKKEKEKKKERKEKEKKEEEEDEDSKEEAEEKEEKDNNEQDEETKEEDEKPKKKRTKVKLDMHLDQVLFLSLIWFLFRIGFNSQCLIMNNYFRFLLIVQTPMFGCTKKFLFGITLLEDAYCLGQ